jgi:hypothetical protein
MTTLELYRKHKSGEISREKFLYEVRRDNNLPWITNLTSYNDAITILKHKGIVTDETPVIVGIPAIGIMTEAKEAKKELTLDTVNPYEYRHGLQHELAEMDDYSTEALEKAKATVLKNLNKDANFYSTLLNQKQSPYKFKAPETDKSGMQVKADGYLKKEAKKDEKSNVQDSLGKKEEGSKKPKGVKVMPDKGVEGKEKVVKENIEEAFRPGVDLGSSFEKLKGQMSAEDEFKSLLSKYDWYYEMSDDPRVYDRGIALDKKLAVLGNKIGVNKAVELFNTKAPSDRKITSSFFMEGKDKHAKLKEILKNKVKEAIYRKPSERTFIVASSPTSQGELKKQGYTEIPGTKDAVGLYK